MSYSLMALDSDETPSVAQVHALLETAEDDIAAGVVHAPTEKLAAFATDVAAAFPSLAMPASADLGGRGLSYSVGQADLFDVLMEFEELAWRHDVILYDAQEGSVRRPRTE